MSQTSQNYDAVILGSTPDGIATACLLAKKGRKVALIEEQKELGEGWAPHSFGQGFSAPGVFHPRKSISSDVVDALSLKNFGLKYKDSADVTAIWEASDKPYYFADRPDVALKLLQDQDPTSVAGYKNVTAFIERVAPLFNKLQRDFPPNIKHPDLSTLTSMGILALNARMLGKNDMIELLRTAPMNVLDWLNEYKVSDALKVALTAPAILGQYLGPYSPATASNALWQLSQRGEKIAGGNRALLSSLVKALNSCGVKVITNQKVKQLTHTKTAVTGVLLENGEQYTAKYVGYASHPKKLLSQHLPSTIIPTDFRHELKTFRTRGMTTVILLGVKGKNPFDNLKADGLNIDRVITANKPITLEKSFDPAKYRSLPEAPVLSVYVPHDDDQCAPADHSLVNVHVHSTSYQLDAGWNEAAKEQVLKTALDQLNTITPGFKDRVVARSVLSPVDLESQFGLVGGHMSYGEISLDQLVFRPGALGARCETPVEGLYLCGPAQHPAGDLSLRRAELAAKAMK